MKQVSDNSVRKLSSQSNENTYELKCKRVFEFSGLQNILSLFWMQSEERLEITYQAISEVNARCECDLVVVAIFIPFS